MGKEEQIKFGFENDQKFKADEKSETTWEKKMQYKKYMKQVVREFWELSVDEQLKYFKKAFQYPLNTKPEEIDTNKVMLDVLNEYSQGEYTSENYNAIPKKDLNYNQLLVLNYFSMLKEQKDGTETILPDEFSDKRRKELKAKSKKHFPRGKSRTEWMLGDDN